jgi:acetyl-CoA C-acetyltransferase
MSIQSSANSSASDGSSIVITHALRTPIGKYLGAFTSLSGVDLGVSAVKSLLAQSGIDPKEVDEVILGNSRQAGSGPNPARQVAIRAGLPDSVCAMTTNMACGSGMKTLEQGADSLRLGRSEVVIVGGLESMSGLPHYLPNFRTGYRLGHAPVVDAMYKDGFECPLADMLMGATAENLAESHSITREQQDEYAIRSQNLAEAAVNAGYFDAEIAPVEVKGRKGQVTVVDKDEHIRFGAEVAKLAKLKPVFAKEGSVTAGNSSGITDGAAVLLMMTASKAQQLGLEVLANLGHMTQSGVDPKVMGIGPVPAIRELCEKSGRAIEEYDLIEINEAFAAQVLACHKDLEFDLDKMNVNGGAIALGHPIGCTGARIVVTLLHEMKRRGVSKGLASLCISGGMGIAAEFTR